MKNIVKFILSFCIGVFVTVLVMIFFKHDRFSYLYSKHYPVDDPLFSVYEPKLNPEMFANHGVIDEWEEQKHRKLIEDFVQNVKDGFFNKNKLSDLNIGLLADVLKNIHKNLILKNIKLSDDKFIQKIIEELPSIDKQYVEYEVFADDVPMLKGRNRDILFEFKHKEKSNQFLKQAERKFFNNNISNLDYTENDLKNLLNMCVKVNFYDSFSFKKDMNIDKINNRLIDDCLSNINKVKKHLDKSIINDFILFCESGGLDYFRFRHGYAAELYVIAKGLDEKKTYDFRDKSLSMIDRERNMILKGYIALNRDIDRYSNVFILLRVFLGKTFRGFF